MPQPKSPPLLGWYLGNRNNPEIYKELFNLCHSIARNVIERVFGLFKKRWSILCTPSFFNIKTQIRIMNACCMLNNFIRVQWLVDPILEDQNAAFLASIDEEILSQTTWKKFQIILKIVLHVFMILMNGQHVPRGNL